MFGMLDDEFDLSDEEEFMRIKQSRTRTIDQSLAALGKKIKLPFTLHIHCSRHSFATLGVNNGADIHSISRLMGHSSVMTTEKVYATVLQETLQKTVDESMVSVSAWTWLIHKESRVRCPAILLSSGPEGDSDMLRVGLH